MRLEVRIFWVLFIAGIGFTLADRAYRGGSLHNAGSTETLRVESVSASRNGHPISPEMNFDYTIVTLDPNEITFTFADGDSRLSREYHPRATFPVTKDAKGCWTSHLFMDGSGTTYGSAQQVVDSGAPALGEQTGSFCLKGDKLYVKVAVRLEAINGTAMEDRENTDWCLTQASYEGCLLDLTNYNAVYSR